MDREITGCRECPFRSGEIIYSCMFPAPSPDDEIFLKTDDDDIPITPDWCPLRTESITIKLKDNV